MFHSSIAFIGATPVDATAIPDALFALGLENANGRGGIVGLVAAHKWFNLAALKGRPDAAARRREIADMMSDAEIATAQRATRDWITRH